MLPNMSRHWECIPLPDRTTASGEMKKYRSAAGRPDRCDPEAWLGVLICAPTMDAGKGSAAKAKRSYERLLCSMHARWLAGCSHAFKASCAQR